MATISVLGMALSGCETKETREGAAPGDASASAAATGGSRGTGGPATPPGSTDAGTAPSAAPPADEAGAGRNGGTGGAVGADGLTTRQRFMLDNLPEAGAVMAAGEYVQRFTTCKRYSIDPSDDRYYPMDEEFDEKKWGVRFRGTCDDGHGGWIRVFWTGPGAGMKKFQAAYRADIAKRMKSTPNAGGKGGFAVGKDFAVIAPNDRTVRQLGGSLLLVLNCNPHHRATGDSATAPALVTGCKLSDEFVS
ncbi:hypothetical protein [Streptomyces sp. YS-3]|uniref:hypothetical protein n=1 Tax=Streptomyces sp. YS-3 TaxID=3381352 RepID=UPI00386233B4